jgi:hypothetical protein
MSNEISELRAELNNFLIENYQGSDLKLYAEYLKSYIMVIYNNNNNNNNDNNNYYYSI